MKAVIGRQDIPGIVIMVIIGLGLTLLGGVKLKNAAETNRWPVTNGTITRSEVGGVMKYYPSVSYTYIVDNTEYTSDRIANMSYNTKNRSAVVKALKKYSPGTEVKVYYNVSDPSKALLEPGINTGNILLLAFGIFILAIPILLMIFMKVEIKKVSKPE